MRSRVKRLLTRRVNIALRAPAGLISNTDSQDVGLLDAANGARGKVVEREVEANYTTTIIIIIKLFEALHVGLLSSLSGVEKSGSWGFVCCSGNAVAGKQKFCCVVN